jgi:predicted CXXCH cytochrome family protein
MMLVGGKIECTSCHDVHNRYTAGSNAKGLVKVSLEHSSLCLKCHTK